MNDLQPIEPEYIYTSIPAEYVCVYQKILAMLADYGEEMLKDCKASCTDKNSGVIECFNMFNSAVAARKLGKDKLAALIIKYIKAKINQIYKGKDNSTSFVFPIDETGSIKAFVTCSERPKFEIKPEDMNLYEHKFGNGFTEHFKLGPEDESPNGEITPPVESNGLSVILIPTYELINNNYRPCAEIEIKYNGNKIDINNTTYSYYFDNIAVNDFKDITNLSTGVHNFKCIVTYMGVTKIANVDKYYKGED